MMKKAIAVLFAVLFVLGAMLTPPAAALEVGGQTVIYTIANSTLLPLRSDTMPFFSGGLLYVPYTVFTDYFGIVSISNTRDNLFLLVNENNTLFFSTAGEGCYDRSGKTYSYSILYSGGQPYVPATFVSNFFGMMCSYYAAMSVVRIKDINSTNTDAFTIAALSGQMKSALDGLIASIPQTPDEPDLPPEPVFVPFDLYLCFTDIGAGGAEAVLDTLSRLNLRTAFFVSEREILENEALIRRICVEGHTLGLVAPCSEEDSAGTMLKALDSANDALDRVLNMKTRIVMIEQGSSAPSFTEEMREALRESGYRYWDRTLPDGETEVSEEAEAYLESLTAQFLVVGSTTVLGLTCSERDAQLIEGVRGFIRENDCRLLTLDDIVSPVNLHGDMW